MHMDRDVFSVIRRTVFFVAGFALLLIVVFEIRQVLLFFAAAFVFTLILNPAVNWLEKQRINRVLGTLAVLFFILLATGLFVWFLLPALAGQTSGLAAKLPGYVRTTYNNIRRSYHITRYLPPEEVIIAAVEKQVIPAVQSFFLKISDYVFSFLDILFYLVLFLSIVAYSLIDPRPLVSFYLVLFPAGKRDKAARAFKTGYESTLGWMKATVVSGAIEAVASFVFLLFLGIPAALLWGALAFSRSSFPKFPPTS